jgi:hypothetical protein
MKKRKRFYNNKKRNQKWTEEEKGRKIDFADKYIEGGTSSDKFDSKRPKSSKNSAIKKAKKQKRIKNLIIAVICIALICVGYTGMDVYMTQKAGGYKQSISKQEEESGMRDVSLRFSSFKTDSISLDSSVMLSSVINDTAALGFTSIAFDAKRSDGTIGYASKLASVDTYNALSSPASKPQASVKALIANDLMPIAIISCYKDNVAPQYLKDAAITTKKGKLYKDEEANTYLNPDSALAYAYIKDIVNELSSMGVSVFVLCDTELPEDISESYNDGFEPLAKRLYSDIGSNIKLLEAVEVSLKGKDEKDGKITNAAIKKEIGEFEKIDKNKTYLITSSIESKRLIEQLAKNNVSSYIIINA